MRFLTETVSVLLETEFRAALDAHNFFGLAEMLKHGVEDAT